MPLSAPASIEKEHEEIWQLAIRIQHLSGKTDSIAERLARVLKPHIDKEEAFAYSSSAYSGIRRKGS
jgi:hypothetical protein